MFSGAVRIGKNDAICYGLKHILRSGEVRGIIPCDKQPIEIKSGRKFTLRKGTLTPMGKNAKQCKIELSMIQGFWIEPKLAKQIKIHVATVAGELANGDTVAA